MAPIELSSTGLNPMDRRQHHFMVSHEASPCLKHRWPMESSMPAFEICSRAIGQLRETRMIEPGFDGENDPLIPYIKSQRFPVEEFF